MTDEQRKLTYLREHSNQLQQKQIGLDAVFSAIESANDEEAAALFRRLRSGETAAQLAQHVQASQTIYGIPRQEATSASSASREQQNHPETQYRMLTSL